ncbi:MAG: GTP-binding protein [Syntrophotaleaceae bacterium]
MRLVTVAGPPSSGKTSVVLRVAETLVAEGLRIGIIKFDCLSSEDEHRYARAGLPVKTGLAGGLCPDHFFIANIEQGLQWGIRSGFDLLISESAGLCNRCSPHIDEVLAVCVVDNLSGMHTPRKIGPMLKTADVAVITKGDIVSQAEREVFAFRVRQVNPKAAVLPVNGLTGQGSLLLQRHIKERGLRYPGRQAAAFLHAGRPLFLLPGRNPHRSRLSDRQHQDDGFLMMLDELLQQPLPQLLKERPYVRDFFCRNGHSAAKQRAGPGTSYRCCAGGTTCRVRP